MLYSLSVPQQQSQQALDILTWIKCFILYIAVVFQKRPDLVPPITAKLHTVMKLEQSVGSMSWFQYDWRARRKTCAAGASTWGRCDLWRLLTCMPGSSGCIDPFDPLPQKLKAERTKCRPNPNPDSQQIKPSQGQPNANKVEYADSTTEPSWMPIWKSLHFYLSMHSVQAP